MKLSDYDIPQTTSLILIGPKGSGKSSLINRISKVFEEDHFTPERAQVSCISLNSFEVFSLYENSSHLFELKICNIFWI